ncbi:MAG: repeat domain protein [Myxococcaceae bacterium]|nr:repeat domain protein [Myxococcaceae bacterium]
MAAGELAGALGNGTATNSLTPSTVSGLTDATQVALGAFHPCARRATGAVARWGTNTYGQIGDGTMSTAVLPRPSPVCPEPGTPTGVGPTGRGWGDAPGPGRPWAPKKFRHGWRAKVA